MSRHPGQNIKKAYYDKSTLLSPLDPIENRCLDCESWELLNKAADVNFHTEQFTPGVSAGRAPPISPSLHVQNPALRGVVKIRSLPTRACNEQAAPTACSSFTCDRRTSHHESDCTCTKYFPTPQIPFFLLDTNYLLESTAHTSK